MVAAFKCGRGASAEGFGKIYHRVRLMAFRAIGEVPSIICQGWGRFGDRGGVAASFIVLEVQGSRPGEAEPTEEALLSPGGASAEEVASLAPQRADEISNEFDFTDSSAADTSTVTLSYGEHVVTSESIDFEPVVNRAERFARTYHAFLRDLGDTRSERFTILRREWFLANPDLVTIHICFAP